MNTIVIIHHDGTRSEYQADANLSIDVQPGDEVILLDENGEPIEAELKRDGEDLDIKFDDGTAASLNNFYAGVAEAEPITVALSAQSTVEDYAEFEGRVGNLPNSGDFSLMRLSSTGYTDFIDALDDFGREISALGEADNTPSPLGTGGADGGGGIPEDFDDQGDGSGDGYGGSGGSRSAPRVTNIYNPPQEHDHEENGDPLSYNRFHDLEEDGVPTVKGRIPLRDPDGDHVYVYLGEGTQYGEFNFTGKGQYNYTPNFDNPTIQALNVGDTLVDYATLRLRDVHGNESLSVIRFDITGTNDDPIAEPGYGTVAEPGSNVDVAFATGKVEGSDVDNGAELTFNETGTPAYGTIDMDDAGNWTYLVDPANTTVQALNVGEALTETIDYEVIDEHGATSTSTITINILGTNDAPVAQAETGTVAEDTPLVIGQLDATDIDNGSTLTFTPESDVIGDQGLGNFTVNADGIWLYDLDNTHPDVQALAVDETLTDTHTYIVTDEHGATDTETITVTITGTNDAPVATDDSITTDENADITFAVLTNDTDVDGDPLTVDSIDDSALTGGTAVLNGDDTITFDPGTDFDYLGEGETTTETISYTISDDQGGTATATVTITVTGSNDGPTAVNDTGSVGEDATVNLDLLDNDSDPDTTDTLTITAINGVSAAGGMPLPSGATVTIKSDGTVDYDPGDAFDYLDDTETATDTFTYAISDGHGGTDTATATITINGSNDPTVTQPDTATTDEDTSIVIDVLANDNDPDNSDNPLTVASVTQPPVGQGSAINNGTNVTFDPGTDFNDLAAGETEEVIFTYTTDTGATESVTITVTGTNDGPTAVADTGTTDQDTSVNLDLLLNDTDPDTSDTLTITAINDDAAAGTMTLPSGATITIKADGTVDYDPNGQFDYLDDTETATDTFTYAISDGNGGTASAIATVTINGLEDPTVIVADTATTDENSSIDIDVLANDSDPDTNDTPLTVASITQPPIGQGSAVNNTTDVTFDPGTDFDDLAVGETEDVTFTYTTNTGDTENVTVTVTGTNDGPIAVNDVGAVNEDDTLSVTTVNGVIDDNDTDLDTSDVLTVTDIRTGPEAGSGTFGIVGNGLAGTYGTLTLADDGSYDYVADQPAADALSVGITATDTFTYEISDGNGGTDTAELVITVTGTNDVPVALDDTGAVNEDATLNVIAANGVVDNNDTDLDGDTLTVTDARTDIGTYGTLTLAADGGYDYAADQAAADALAIGETATDSFSYTISDGNGGSDTATLTITVTGTNDGPVAVDDAETTDQDSSVSIDLLTNDSDLDASDTLTVTEINGIAAGGTITLGSGALLTVNGDGTVDYDPNGQFDYLDDTETATDTFTYAISDGNGGTASATATVTITGNEDPTVIVADTATTDENSSINIDVLANDSDPDTSDNPLTVASITQPPVGQGSAVNNTTDVTFDPGTDFDDLAVGETEDVTFTYTTNTGDTETVTVTVTGTNDGPIAVNDVGAVNEDDTLSVTTVNGVIDDNDTDLDTSDVLTVTDIRTGPEAGSGTIGIVGNGLIGTYGTLTIADDGSYEYVADQPAADALSVGITATDTFTYEISDGNGGTDTAELVITVTGTNDVPVALDDTGSVDEDATLSVVAADGVVDNNDTDLDGDTLTVTDDRTDVGTYGTLTLAADGGYDYAADQAAADALAIGETATDSFSYTISDGNGGSDTATLTITVTGTNDGPVAVDDAETTDQDSSVSIDLLTNDSDLDASDTLTVTEINGIAAGGTITLGSGALLTVNGDGTVDYDPNGQFDYLDDTETATDTFTYAISDGNGGTASATATVTITGNEDPTVIVADTATTDENSSINIDVLANDSDPDTSDNPLTVASITQPPVGQGSAVNNTTDVTFDPGTDFDDLAVGETEDVTFTYTTNTGDTETVTVTVTGTNDGPVAVNDIGAINEDDTLSVTTVNGVIDDNDTDPDTSDVLTITDIRTGPEAGSGTIGIVGNGLIGTYGTLTIADDGSYEYVADQPAADALSVGITATDTFTYEISDGNGGTDTAELVITVTGTNDVPVAVDDTGSVDEDATLSVVAADGVVDNNDTDLDGDTLTVTDDRTDVGTYGTLTLAADGGYDYAADQAAADALAVGETATDSFSYTISDGNGGSDTATLTITVTGTNDGPVAVDDAETTDQDSPVSIDLLTNDSDLDASDTLTVTEINGIAAGGTITLGSGALLTVNGDGTVDYDPNGQFDYLDDTETATDTFTYAISDGNGGSASATATVTITGNEDPTVIVADTATTDENSSINIDVLANDSDPDTSDNPLTVASITQPPVGQGSAVNNTTDVTFDPGTDFDDLAVGETEDVTFTYTTNTGDTETVTVTVTGTNDGPTALADTETTDQDNSVSIDLLDNDSDPDTSDALTVTEIDGIAAGGMITLPSGAILTVNGDGTVDYDPNGQFDYLDDTETATDSFTYTISDGNGGTDTATATVTISGNEDPTVIVADAATTDENTPVVIDVLGNDSDPDTNDNPLTVASVDVTGLTGGSVTNNGTNVTFDPGTDFDDLAVGESEVVTFTYTTNTGATETVTVTVTGTNDGPTAVNDVGAVNEDATLSVNTINGVIEDNDTDPDSSDTLTVTDIRTGTEAGSGTFGLVGNALTGTYGTLTLAEDGSYDYVADQAAADALAVGITATDTFTYSISDGNGGTDTAELVITVTGTNDPPVAVDDTGAVEEDATLTVNVADGVVENNDTDLDGDALTVTDARTEVGTYGTLILSADGSYTYDADQAAANALAVDETATDTFSYTIDDLNGGTDTATLTITVTGTNDDPIAVVDADTTDQDNSVNVDLLGNDSDPDTNDALTLTEINGIAAGGTITLGSGALLTVRGDGTVDYDPNGQFDYLDDTETATDTFTYTISDGNGGTASASATVTISGNEDPTVIVADAATTDENTPVVIDVLGNDSDPDTNDNPLTVASVDVTGLTGGSVTNNGNNVTFDPGTDFDDLAVGESEVVTFTYTTNTGATETVTVTVTGTNDGPTALADTETTDQDNSVSIDLLDNDSDPDTSDVLTVSEIDGIAAGGMITLPSGAILTVNGDGTVDYDPNGQFDYLDDTETATDSFTYTISDGNGGTDTATATVTISGNEDPTVIVADAATTDENTTVVIDVLGNDSDPDTNDNPLTVASVDVTGLTGGSVTNNGTNVTFDPGTDFDDLAVGESEVVTFTYTTNTGATETVTVTVTGTNDDPTAIADTETTDQDSLVNVDLLDNDSDPDTNDNLTLTEIEGVAAGGTITLGSGALLTVRSDGTVDYDPNGQFDYLDDTETATDTFTYTISDGNGGNASASATVTISGNEDPTVIVADAGTTDENTPIVIDVLGNDSDPDTNDTPLTVASVDVTGLTGGSVTNNGNNVTFDPDTDFDDLAVGESEVVTFTYTTNTGATETVTVTVTGTNAGPVAVDDVGAVDEDDSLTVSTANGIVDDNDTDADTNDTLTVTQVRTGPEGGSGTIGIIGNPLAGTYGTLYLDSDGSYSYDADLPAADALADGVTATDTFTYSISDGNGGTDTAELVITVTGINDAPVAVDDTGAVTEADTLSVNTDDGVIVDNDIDLDLDSLDVTAIRTGPEAGVGTAGTVGAPLTGTYGTLTIADDGSYEYVADQAAATALSVGATDTDTFTYEISDGNGGTDTAELVITVTGLNDPPVAVDDPGPSVDSDSSTSFSLTGNDSDPNGDSLTITQIDGAVAGGSIEIASGALVSVNVDGTVDYQPNGAFNYLDPGETATDTFTYTISDGNGGTDTATATVTINGLLELKADLWIGNDQSGSVQIEGGIDEFDASRQLISGTANLLAFEGDIDSQTALFSWSDTGEQVFDLALTDDKAAFIADSAAHARTYGGGTDVADAISYGAGLIGDASNGGRAGVNQILLIITDAFTNQITPGPEAAILAAAQAAKDDGIIVAFIGIDDAGTDPTATAVLEAAASQDAFGNPLFFGFTDYGSVTTATIVNLVKTFANVPPIVIDLDNDGVEFDGIDEGIQLDVDNDGELEQTAWADEDDGVLIYDANNNNDVDGNEEYAFAQYADERGATDLEGLRSFDTDDDGLLTAGDAEFGSFKVWQDSDGSGTVDDGELVALDAHGIESISLTSDGVRSSTAGGDVNIEGILEVGYVDGSTGQAADASFAYQNIDPNELVEDDGSEADLAVVANDGSTVNLDAPVTPAADEANIAPEEDAETEVATEAPEPAPEPEAAPPVPPVPTAEDDAAAAAATGAL